MNFIENKFEGFIKLNKLLFLGQYPLDNLNSAPKIRTFNLYQSLKELVDTDFITGTRNSRRWPLLRYIFSGKIFKVDAVYLEAATSTSMEIDILILLIARLRKIPIGIYIRDIFPMFELTNKDSLKNIILIFGWYTSIWFYKRLASILLFPTETLAKSFKIKKYKVLPPGGSSASYQEFRGEERLILYSGGISERYGVIQLLEAVEILHNKYKDIRLFFVCRKDEIKLIESWMNREWLTVAHMNYDEIIENREQIYLSVIPIIKSTYNDLAMPVKMFDYMSLGRPIVATDCIEMEIFIKNHDIGLICKSTPEDIALKIEILLQNYELTKEISKRSHKVLNEKFLWKHRAEDIIQTLLNKF